MNITFLIGNGFDINLGLKTRYTNFYPYYLEKYPEEMIAKFISQDKNYENWADLELGLGDMLEFISKDKSEEFLDSKGVLEECLTEYLKNQNVLFEIRNLEKATEKFKKNIINFSDEFNDEEKEKYKSTISTYRNEINFSFITFNYTDALDRIIEECQKDTNVIGYFKDSNSDTRQMKILKPLHIHGRLDEGMVLGVNDESQISNESLKSDNDFKDYFIKQNVLKESGNLNIEKAKKIIDNSNYVCLFGLSIGDTDSLWWKYLLEWLQKNLNNRLVIYFKENGNVSFSAQQILRKRNDCRKKFIKQAQCTKDEIIDKVKRRIIIINNSEIFNIPGVVVNSEKNILQEYPYDYDTRIAVPAVSNSLTELAYATPKIPEEYISAHNSGIQLLKEDDEAVVKAKYIKLPEEKDD